MLEEIKEVVEFEFVKIIILFVIIGFSIFLFSI